MAADHFENSEKLEPQFDQAKPIRSTGDMATWYTGKPCEYAKHSHVNFCVFDSTWEATEAYELDRNPAVAAWAKNDHLGFEVLYIYRGVVRKYRPDFIIRLQSGEHLVLETKGQDTEQDRTKRRFLDEWVRAVNEHGGFGHWCWAVSKDPGDIKDILASAASVAAVKVPERTRGSDELVDLGQITIRIEDAPNRPASFEDAQHFLNILKRVIREDAKPFRGDPGWDVSDYRIQEGSITLWMKYAIKKWVFVGLLSSYGVVSQYPSFRDGLELIYDDFNRALEKTSQSFHDETGTVVAIVGAEREDPAQLFEQYGKYVVREDEPRIRAGGRP